MLERLLLVADFGEQGSQRGMRRRGILFQADGAFELRLRFAKIAFSLLNQTDQKCRFEMIRLGFEHVVAGIPCAFAYSLVWK